MPDVREHFPDIENMDVGALHEKRAEIMSRANGNFETLDDDSLAELLQIGRTLRRKAASPGGVGKVKRKGSETILDDIA